VIELQSEADQVFREASIARMGERINLAVPRRPSISEAWLDRHASALSSMLTAVSTFEQPTTPWLTGVPHIHLGPRAPIIRRYGVGRLTSMTGGESARSRLREIDATANIVHFANFLKLLGDPGKLLPDVATLVYVHGFDITWSPFRWCPIPYKSFGNTERYVERLIEMSHRVLFVANSQHSRQHLLQAGFPEDRVEVCYLPVETPRAASRHEDRKSLSPIQLLYVGRFVDFKGPVETVKAVALARTRGAEVELTMVGDGELRGEVESTIDALDARGYIKTVGFVPNDEVHRRLRESDGFLLHNKVARKSGQVEAFGYAHAEALANGVPVLTATAGAPAEYLEHCGNSLLVEPGDIEGQAANIERFASDHALRNTLECEARATVERLFSRQAHAERVGALLRNERGS